MNPIPTAVITGGHGYDVPAFQRLFRLLGPPIDAYVQHLEDFARSPVRVRDAYRVVVFYGMPPGEPETGREEDSLIRLMERKTGLFPLHHGILAWPQWSLWDQVVGIADRGTDSGFAYEHDQTMRLHVEDPSHPITPGIEGWDLVDETYLMNGPEEDSHVLISTDHPRSMWAVAWTRTFRGARVFCLQSGHDRSAFRDTGFQGVLSRGIQWCAREL